MKKSTKYFFLLCILLSSCSGSLASGIDSNVSGDGIRNIKQNEAYYNQLFCESVGGKTETSHSYQYPDNKKSYVKIDCETETTVYEGGIDKRSSLDSIQQALFFSILTKKEPAVVIYDTDAKVGNYEYRIQSVCERAKIRYISYPVYDTSLFSSSSKN